MIPVAHLVVVEGLITAIDDFRSSLSGPSDTPALRRIYEVDSATLRVGGTMHERGGRGRRRWPLGLPISTWRLIRYSEPMVPPQKAPQ